MNSISSYRFIQLWLSFYLLGLMRKLAIIGTVLLLIIATVTVVLKLNFPNTSKVSVTLLGFTNDPVGSQIATFSIRNDGASPIEWWAPRFDIQTPNGSITETINTSVQGSAVLAAGASATFTVLPPTNHSHWRIWLHINSDLKPTRFVRGLVDYALVGAGRKPRNQMEYVTLSQWVEME